MDKYIYDDKNGLWYELQGDYYIPCLILPAEKQAQERMERLTEQMKRAQGITEQLKTENALEWTQRMNNIRACAKEIIEKEIIFA